MKRLTAFVAVGLATAAVTSGVAFAEPSPPGGGELRPGEAYAGAGDPHPSGGGVGAARVPAGLKGVDVSSHQMDKVNWPALRQSGVRYAFVKATESADTSAKPEQGYVNPYFAGQYGGARKVGMIRGAYHFAQPHESGGLRQADYFINHGGGWTQDGWTLPGVLDIENNPYGHINGLNQCYNLTKTQSVNWIRAFVDRYRQRTGRYPIIYTTTNWWKTCTGNNAGFGQSPLWLANYGPTPGPLPAGWRSHTFWQYTQNPEGSPLGNPNVLNGTLQGLQKLAIQARTSINPVNATPEPVRKGRPVTVSGKLSFHNGSAWRLLSGHRVSFWFRASGTSKWVSKGSMLTNANGQFRKAFTAQRDGFWRVYYPGAPRYFSTTSANDYVDVR
ncbi:GH25 family lysozyme [Thermomonospora umbrina]|uniref:lysozyme n=1 Tax=Thermomonospora umbrina TaxID=111806 RepID=A0A3D9SL99_9ACTN|nr:GH25 family lysozyme [Thermomonospora umbrina]REE96689.1 GH25 family lysozyme M1 (1,4-beta-N-acetylmuramidase) [Thermomonospora umbrina]